MHYRLRSDKRSELQEGRTVAYLAGICKYSRQYLTDAFNSKIDITRECAINIIRGAAANSLKIAIKLNQEGVNNTLKYFFEEIE